MTIFIGYPTPDERIDQCIVEPRDLWSALGYLPEDDDSDFGDDGAPLNTVGDEGLSPWTSTGYPDGPGYPDGNGDITRPLGGDDDLTWAPPPDPDEVDPEDDE